MTAGLDALLETGGIIETAEAEFLADPMDYLSAQGFHALRKMPDGRWAGVKMFLFSYGLCEGLNACGLGGRWCFETMPAAVLSLGLWTGEGDPPGPWIKAKGQTGRGDYVNPHLFYVTARDGSGNQISHRKFEHEIDKDAMWSANRRPETVASGK